MVALALSSPAFAAPCITSSWASPASPRLTCYARPDNVVRAYGRPRRSTVRKARQPAALLRGGRVSMEKAGEGTGNAGNAGNAGGEGNADKGGPGGNEAEGSGALASAVPDTLNSDVLRAVQGVGRADCKQCEGVGTVTCPVCDGKGFVTMSMMDTVSAAQCRLCRGRGVVPCPSCRDFVYRSVIWWDEIPSEEDDPEEKWREGPDGKPRIPWSPPPA